MAVINNLLAVVETIRVANSATAAQTAVESSAVDTAGKIGVRFTALLGDVTAASVLGLKVQGSDNGSSGWTDLVGALSFTAGGSDADNKALIIDAVRPEFRYVRAVLSRTGANAVVDGILADVYGPKETPVTQGATVLASRTLPNAAAA
jgi:hypothetical protein